MAKKKKKDLDIADQAIDTIWNVAYLMFGGKPR